MRKATVVIEDVGGGTHTIQITDDAGYTRADYYIDGALAHHAFYNKALDMFYIDQAFYPFAHHLARLATLTALTNYIQRHYPQLVCESAEAAHVNRQSSDSPATP